jgi:hypothetical protein
MTGICTHDLAPGPLFIDDDMHLWAFQKVVVRRTFVCIERASEKVECQPRALTDDWVRYGSDVHSDSGDVPIQVISLISQTTEVARTADYDDSISTDDKSAVTSQCTEAASTADGDEPIRSISFTSEDLGSELCDAASGDTDDDAISVCSWVTNEDWGVTGINTDSLPLGLSTDDTASRDTDDLISLCSWVTNEDWDMTGINTDFLPLGQFTEAASTADDDDPIQSTFFVSKSTEDSSTDGTTSEFAGDVGETHGKAQSSGDEHKKAKRKRSWRQSGRTRQRETARKARARPVSDALLDVCSDRR